MPLLLLLRLSTRNLLRHRRRSLMLLLAIVVAVSGVLFMSALIRGMQQDMRAAALDNLTGSLKLLAPGYRDDPGIRHSFTLPPAWQPPSLAPVSATALVGWAPRIAVPAVILSERETRGVQLLGVDPQREGISFLAKASYQGRALTDAGDTALVIGVALAEQLQTKVGRRLVVMTQGADGRNHEVGFRVAGLFDSDGTTLEKTLVFTGLDHARQLLGTQAVTEVSIRLQQEPVPPILLQQLQAQFPGLDILSWQQLEPQAAAMFAFADAAVFIWFLIMMGALVFGLMNTLITSVMERVREFGMLRAVGMRPGAVMLQVVLESSLVMAAGVLLGSLLGGLGTVLLHDGIDLSRWAQGVELAGMRSRLVPMLELRDLLLIAGLSLLLGVLASLWPAWRAVRITPLEALRR